MKTIQTVMAILLSMAMGSLYAQKTISEGSLVYNIVIQTGEKEPKMADALDGAVTTVYIKGTQTRTDMVSALGSETTIHDAKTGAATILKEYSGQKLMYSLTAENWKSKNKKYDGIVFENTTETASIAGYNCIKAIAKLSDGSSFWVYYTPDLVILNKDYDQTFKNLPGLALQYEYVSGKLKFKYTVDKIDFNPVASSKFELPKSGYRLMEYTDKKN